MTPLAAAAALLSAGRPREALIPLRQALQQAPFDANILHDLGLACIECGELDEAIASLQASIAANPRFADSHLRLGIALEAAGAFDDALAAYRAAWAIQPRLADARYREADLLDSLGHGEQAADVFRRAAASAPKTTLGRIAAARAARARREDKTAEKILRQALALERDNPIALDQLGQILAETGRFEEARAMFLKAIARAPRLAGSFYDAVRCRPIRADDIELIRQMQAAAENPALDPVQRARVHLALGRAADDLGQHEKAMRHYDTASAVRDAVAWFDLAAFEARVARTAQDFPNVHQPQNEAAVGASPKPLLIVGLPRSGTTLVEQILSCHSRVAAGGELAFWNQRGAAWERLMMSHQQGQQPAFLQQAAADYCTLLRSIAPRAGWVTDKMPLNFQWVGLIQQALPEATIIWCSRSPIDTALSIHQTHFNPRMPFPTGGAALVAYVRGAETLRAHWQAHPANGRVIEMSYEALTADPAREIPALIAACGLDWEDACLRPEENPRSVQTPSKFQVRQKISRAPVGKWRAYEPWLGDLRPLAEEESQAFDLRQENRSPHAMRGNAVAALHAGYDG